MKKKSKKNIKKNYIIFLSDFEYNIKGRKKSPNKKRGV